jgi:hypothetical protein
MYAFRAFVKNCGLFDLVIVDLLTLGLIEDLHTLLFLKD